MQFRPCNFKGRIEMNIDNQVLPIANPLFKTDRIMQPNQSCANHIFGLSHRMIFFIFAFFIIVSFVAPVSYAATMLFKSNFGAGVLLGSPYNFTTNGAWQALSGTDKETGYTWPIKALGSDFSGIQMITTDPITPLTLPDYAFNEIRKISGPKGNPVNALSQNIKVKGPAGTWDAQSPLIIQRPWTIGDVTDLYITYWYKNPAISVAQLDPAIPGAGEMLQFQFKTGGYNNTWAGDYRLSMGVMKGDAGNLYWRTHADNQASGPSPKLVEYWREENHTVLVPVDAWYKVEIFWHRSGGSDGRFWAAINGEKIVDYHGPNMGDHKLPISRIMVDSLSTGGHGPIEGNLTGLQIWSGFPCGDGVSCHNFDTVAPSVPTALTGKFIKYTSSATVGLSWNASSDTVGVAGYYIYRDGTKIGVSTKTSYTDILSGSATGVLHSYTVKAFDAAENLSGSSSAISIIY